jgi:hypothetical protein
MDLRSGIFRNGGHFTRVIDRSAVDAKEPLAQGIA